MPLAAIGDLDLLTFNALLQSVMRVNNTLRTERAWTAMIAAQGTQKGMNSWLRGFDKAAEKVGAIKTKKSGLLDLVRDFGSGF